MSYASKLNNPYQQIYDIIIYGESMDTTMLAYYIDKNVKEEGFREYDVKINITVVGPGNNK